MHSDIGQSKNMAREALEVLSELFLRAADEAGGSLPICAIGRQIGGWYQTLIGSEVQRGVLKNRGKNSLCISSFGSNPTLFTPGGCHPEAGMQDILTKVRQAVSRLGDLMDGYEFHYPNEVNEGNIAKIQRALDGIFLPERRALQITSL